MHSLYGALPGPYVPVRVSPMLWSHMGTLMRFLSAEPHSTAVLLFPCLELNLILLLLIKRFAMQGWESD